MISTGVRIVCSNVGEGSKQRSVVLSTEGSPTLRENIAAVYGAKFLHTLDPVDIDLGTAPAPAGSDVGAAGGSSGGGGGGGGAGGGDRPGAFSNDGDEVADDVAVDVDVMREAEQSDKDAGEPGSRVMGFVSKAGNVAHRCHALRVETCSVYVVPLGAMQAPASLAPTTTSSSCSSTAAPSTCRRFVVGRWLHRACMRACPRRRWLPACRSSRRQ
jgi:hypothetical protein